MNNRDRDVLGSKQAYERVQQGTPLGNSCVSGYQALNRMDPVKARVAIPAANPPDHAYYSRNPNHDQGTALSAAVAG